MCFMLVDGNIQHNSTHTLGLVYRRGGGFELHGGKLSRVKPYVFHAGRWNIQHNSTHTPGLGMGE